MGIFDFWKTDAERKRDEYDKLHDYIKESIHIHDTHMNEISEAISSYEKGIPNMSTTKISSDIFMRKSDKVTDCLKKYFHLEKEKRASLTIARDQAYAKYLEYKAQAHREAIAKKEKEEKEKQEREERLRNG